MPDRSIDWVRWLFYLMAGVPLVVWLFFARDRVQKCVGVLFVTLFIQDSFAGRRYFWALSLAPSLVAVYVALLSQVLERRRMPSMGVYGPLWGAFLFFALLSVAQASFGTGLLQPNVKELQFSYLEGIVFFLFGIIALQTTRELRSFFHWMVLIGALLALQHFFVAATGFHFRGSAIAVKGIYYGGVLDNGNTLGSYYALGVPTTLALALSRDTSPRMRVACYASLVLMIGSLFLTGSRGGILFTLFGCGLVMVVGGLRVGKLMSAGVLGAAFAVIGIVGVTTFLRGSSQEVVAQMQEEGLETNRWHTFTAYTLLVLKQPLGLGMAPENALPKANQYGVRAVTAHNIYLDIAIQAGLGGTLIFVVMAVSFLMRNRRAARAAPDAQTRDVLTFVFLSLAGYLGVGFFEPIYTGSTKMNNLYWLLAGLNVAAVDRVFAARRDALEAPAAAPVEAGLRAHAPHG